MSHKGGQSNRRGLNLEYVLRIQRAQRGPGNMAWLGRGVPTYPLSAQIQPSVPEETESRRRDLEDHG